ncbi:MAG: hypothetical protein Q9160_007699 [Pyrenula sp. 1 TL-2023]
MFCQITADELSALLAKLSGDLEKNRWYGSIRIALKSDELDRRRQKLESAKLNLVLAQQSLSSAFQFRHSQQFSEIINMHKVLRDTVAFGKQKETSFDGSRGTSHQAQLSASFSSSFPRMRKKHYCEDRRSLVTLPRLFNWVIQLQLRRHSKYWTFNFRIWNHRSDDSPIFKCVIDGDIDGLKKVISARQASLYDVTPSGITLLHIAVKKGDYSMAKYLISHVGGVSWVEGIARELCFKVFESIYFDSSQTSHNDTILARIPQPESTDFKSLFHLLKSNDRDAHYEADFAAWAFGKPRDLKISFEDAQEIVQESFQMILDEYWCFTSIARHLKAAFVVQRYGYPMLNPALSRKCLTGLYSRFGKKEVWREAGLARWSSALTSAADSLGRRCETNYSDKNLGNARYILSSIVAAEGRNQLKQLGRQSPLSIFLLHTFRRNWFSVQERVSERANLWVAELKSAGLKNETIEQYCAYEKQHLVSGTYRHWHSQLDDRLVGIRFIRLDTDKSAGAWRVWISWPLDEHAGEFWKGVENGMQRRPEHNDAEDLEPEVPGAWQDEEPERHSCWAQADHVRRIVGQKANSSRKARRLLRQIGFYSVPEGKQNCCVEAQGSVETLRQCAKTTSKDFRQYLIR